MAPLVAKKPPVDEAVDQNDLHRTRGSRAFLPCRAAVIPQDLNYLASLIHRHRKSIGSRRKLNPEQQALLVLACPRKDETLVGPAAGFAVGTTTAWRYAEETKALLAVRAPKLRQAVREAKEAGWANVVLNGTLIPIGRVAADRPSCSGQHRKYGMNLHIATLGGDIVWVSGALPGAVHDKRAEWI